MLVDLLIGVCVGALALCALFGLSRRLERSPGRPPNGSRPRAVRPDGGHASGAELERAKPTGVVRWLTTVDHKDIGLMYFAVAGAAFFWGGTDAIMLRTELLTPEADAFTIETYNALFTMHGITMLFLFATPAIFGFVNYFLPILIGADDMAFPRVNAIAFWLLPISFALIRADMLTDMPAHVIALVDPALAEPLYAISPMQAGWTMYPPMSAELLSPHLDLVLLGLHLSGIATVMGAINVIATIFTERAPDLDWGRLDILSWTFLAQAGLILFAFPMLGTVLLMLLADRNLGTQFFTVEGGGPILYQHLFWFFGHPEVYIVVLPPMGLISFILPQFAGRKLFGFKFIVYSTLAIAVLSFGVWAHHMFTTGIDPRIRGAFMAVTIAIAVPSAVKVFNWMTTMWQGRIRLEAPMLFCIGAIATFIVGGVTGVFLGSIPINLQYHATYYVVGHFHLIITGFIPFAMFAGVYYWYPLLTGRMYDTRLARVHFWTSTVGVLVTFHALLLIGALGLPRRYAEYPAEFAPLQIVATGGAFVIAIGQVVWGWNMLQSYRTGPTVGADPWNLKEYGFFTREWEWFEERLEERGGAEAVAVAREGEE